MALESSYTAQAAGSASGPAPVSQAKPGAKPGDYWELSKLRRCYTDYLFSKREEIDEQIDARRYYHGSQWTTEQIKSLKKRKQPIMTFNRVARKIDGVVGLIEKLRQDPKAYARTPQHEEGAELATASVRYVLEEGDWEAKSPQAAQDGAVDGIGGVELEIIDGDKGDKEIGYELIDIQSFFYDPRSYKMDFSDARYMGIGKWLDEDVAREMFPDAEESAFSETDPELLVSTDRERRWFRTTGVVKQVRIVDIWYKHKGGWCWGIISGGSILMEGKSYFQDEKGKDFSKYIMFSANVDQDGDRYGFIRNMKSAQDGINAKQSKMQHMLASKRIFIRQGGVEDVEKTRAEMLRTDGVVVVHGPVNESVKADDQSFDFAGMDKLLERNINEIEMFGPNPQLMGQRDGAQSGRAIQLLQQAGMAELGPFIVAFKGWKIRLYRAIWNSIQKHWTGERWVRVTDDQNLAQFIQVNGVQIDPMTGQPTLVNAIGSLDVDIIMDEGPDTVNGMADVYETLSNILPSIAPMLNPVQANNIVGTLIETSPLPSEIKKKFKDQAEQAAQQPPPPDPAVESAKMKMQIDAQTAQQSAQIEMAKAQQAAELAQQKAMSDLQMKREATQSDIMLEQEKTQAEIEMMRLKTEAALHVEQAKCSMQMQMKDQEHSHKVDQMHKDGELKRQQATEKSESEAESSKQTEAGVVAPLKEVIGELKKVVEAVTAPRKTTIVRDKAGKVAHAISE